jgi:restriction endonuclease Mrr
MVLIFVWAVAEFLKLVKRMGDRDWSRSHSHNNRLRGKSQASQVVTSSPMNRPQNREVDLSPSKAESNSSDPKPSHTVKNLSKQSLSDASMIQSAAADREVDISQMTWQQFERLFVQVLQRYGFCAEHTGRSGPDGGIDVRCTDSKGQTILVQCKHWRSREVSVVQVREFFGVLVHEQAAQGVIVSSGLFTHEAKRFAENKPLRLVDGEKLLQLLSEISECRDRPRIHYRISHLDTLISSEKCPRCDGRMIRRNGRRGVFQGCERYPECDGSRNL